MRPALSVIVPCYNEEKNLPALVQRFQRARKGVDAELVLVQNGSRDGSATVMRRLAASRPWIRIVTIRKNIGYGYGLRRGLMAGRGEALCWTHADLQTDLGDAITAYRLWRAQPDRERVFVKGRRTGRPIIDHLFSVGMACFEFLVLQMRFWEINAQPNLFPRTFLPHLKDAPDDFSYDLFAYIMAKRRGYRFVRFPVRFPPRVHGTSHWNTGKFSDKWRLIKRWVTLTVAIRRNKALWG